jgi:hypothetical protein
MIAFGGFALTAAAAAPHKVVRNSAALDFSYEWPAEAVAIPALDLKLYTDAKAKLAQAQKSAAEDQALTRRQKRDFNQHDFSASWETKGETPRLLSLQGNFGGFEGGAHPNSYFQALLWDRQTGGEIRVESLFERPNDFAALTRPAYCRKLQVERAKRREGESADGLAATDPFNACPKYSELAISPVDKDKDGRFDTIDFVASAYVAGPYVEGDYEIFVPVTAKIVAALKPGFRSSFEAQPQ